MAYNPWTHLAPATMRYNETLVDGLLRQPANAWTNVMYIIVALMVLYLVRKRGDRSMLAFMPAIAALIGLTSFLYHASNTFLFQFLDLSSMFLLSGLLIALNLHRAGWIEARHMPQLFSGVVLASSALLFAIRGRIGASMFAAEIVAAMAMELFIAFKKEEGTRYRDYLAAFSLCAAAYLFWVLDFTGHTPFDGGNHLMQGHGLWHIINAFCIYYLYRFYGQFPFPPLFARPAQA
jgi:hypothetical protein